MPRGAIHHVRACDVAQMTSASMNRDSSLRRLVLRMARPPFPVPIEATGHLALPRRKKECVGAIQVATLYNTVQASNSATHYKRATCKLKPSLFSALPVCTYIHTRACAFTRRAPPSASEGSRTSSQRACANPHRAEIPAQSALQSRTRKGPGGHRPQTS